MQKECTSYDDIPMTFCSECLWHGKTETMVTQSGVEIEYCPYCGSTTFNTVSAKEWDRMFREKYCRPSYYLCKETDWAKIINTNVSREEAYMIRLNLSKNFK